MLALFLLRMFSFSFNSWEIFLNRIHNWLLFSFSTYFLWPLWFQMNYMLILKIMFPYSSCITSPEVHSSFLSLFFKSLIMICQHGFLCIFLILDSLSYLTLKGVRICYPKVCYVDIRFILSYRHLRFNRGRKKPI